MNWLEGKKVALTGTRKAGEISRLIEKLGGVPLVRPAQATVLTDYADLEAGIRQWFWTELDWMIATTGAGIDTLFQAAREMGVDRELCVKLMHTNIAARGYKTQEALAKYGLTPKIRDEDGTVSGLLRALDGNVLPGSRMGILLHDEPTPDLLQWLNERGAVSFEIVPYRPVPPDAAIMDALLTELLEGGIDAIAFTSAMQARFLLRHAEAKGDLPALIRALNGPVLAAAVGKLTAAELGTAGISRVIVPERERMGSLIVALARYCKQMKERGAVS